MTDPLSGLPRRSLETTARFDGHQWLAEVDGTPVTAASRAELQRAARAEAVRCTGNEDILVVVHFL